jgi:hypothetical protein
MVLLRQACEAAKIAGVREDRAGFGRTGHRRGRRGGGPAAVSWTARITAHQGVGASRRASTGVGASG